MGTRGSNPLPFEISYYMQLFKKSKTIREKNSNWKNHVDCNYLEKFLVGLIDGDGYITTRICKNNEFRFEIRIELKFTIQNDQMLNLFISELNLGRCHYRTINRIKEKIIWLVDTKDGVLKMLAIFNKYPPLTRRRLCQLDRLKFFITNKCSKTFLETKLTFIEMSPRVYITADECLNLSYFPEWLSGFREAEGSFYIDGIVLTYEIGQKSESGIVYAIKDYFSIQSKVYDYFLPSGQPYFKVKARRKSALIKVYCHFSQYFLLGEKIISFKNIFKDWE